MDIVSDGGATPAILARLKDLEATRHGLSDAAAAASTSSVSFSDGADLADRYSARIAELTHGLVEAKDPEEIEIARKLIDHVIIHPKTDDGPPGIEFIGDLMELLRVAGLGETAANGNPARPDPVLELFVSSVKGGRGAEPPPYFMGQSPRADYPGR